MDDTMILILKGAIFLTLLFVLLLFTAPLVYMIIRWRETVREFNDATYRHRRPILTVLLFLLACYGTALLIQLSESCKADLSGVFTSFSLGEK